MNTKEQEAKIKQNEKHQHGVKEIIQFLKENQIVKYIILVSVVLNFFYTSISIGVPFVVKEQLLLDNATVGILETNVCSWNVISQCVYVTIARQKRK